jgi:hypothetical protein
MKLLTRVCNFRLLNKYVQACLFLIILPILVGCSSTPGDSNLKPRTTAEDDAIRNSWYPIKNKECQLLVDKYEHDQESIFNIKNELFTNQKSEQKKTYREMLKENFNLKNNFNHDDLIDTQWDEVFKQLKLNKKLENSFRV